jgi:hypothetical protein
MYKKTKRCNSKKQKFSKKKSDLKRGRTRKLGGLGFLKRGYKNAKNTAKRLYKKSKNWLGSNLSSFPDSLPNLLKKIFKMIGASVSINRSVKFHVLKCMQKDINCKRKGFISRNVQWYRDRNYGDKEECDEIRKLINGVRAAQSKGVGYAGAFITRNLTRNGPMRLIINMPILSLFHHFIYNTDIMNEENIDHSMLKILLKFVQYRLFRGGFDFQHEDVQEDTINEAETLVNNIDKNNVDEATANKVETEIYDIADKEDQDEYNANDDRPINSQHSSSDKSLQKRAKEIFEKEMKEIINHVGNFDDSYCLSEKEHCFLLEQYDKYWNSEKSKKGGGFIISVLKGSTRTIGSFIAAVAAICITFGALLIQNIASATEGAYLFVFGLALGAISLLFIGVSELVISGIESASNAVDRLINGNNSRPPPINPKISPVKTPVTKDDIITSEVKSTEDETAEKLTKLKEEIINSIELISRSSNKYTKDYKLNKQIVLNRKPVEPQFLALSNDLANKYYKEYLNIYPENTDKSKLKDRFKSFIFEIFDIVEEDYKETKENSTSMITNLFNEL